MSVRERCGCGAEFESDQPNCVRLWREWRLDHSCVPTAEEYKDAGGSFAVLETVTDNRRPELHIGFRPSEDDD